jgi:pimeloyl-ACP methyl ester carboxylesterase
MRNIVKRTVAVAAAAAAGLLVGALVGAAGSGAQPTSHPGPVAKPTIVLVHGAWADGSSWAAVTANLQRKGFTVDVEPNPLRGVASDTQYLKDYLATIAGPIVLVGHSYGGMVITNAATGNRDVKGLVYIDAYLPEQGDTVNGLTTAKPGSVLAVPDPSTVFNAVPNTGPDGTVASVDLYVKQSLFPSYFAAGVPAAKAAVLAAGQRPLTLSALTEASPNVPAWRTIPSWALIGTADRVLPPAGQQAMAARAGAHVVKVNAPHLSMVSNPRAVTQLITTAAEHS